MGINFHDTYTVGALSWEAFYLGYRAVVIRIAQGALPVYRVFVYDENGKQIANPPDLDGNRREAFTLARAELRRLRDPLGE